MLNTAKEIYLLIALLAVCTASDSSKTKNDTSDVYISQEIGKNGKRYFIQYRKLGDTDMYVNVRRKALVSNKPSRKGTEDDYEDDETPARLRVKENQRKEDMTNRVLDEEWNHAMNKTDSELPELAHELYKLMEKQDRQSVHNASVIKLLFELHYEWLDNNIFEFDMSSLKSEELEIVDAELHVYRLQDGNYTPHKNSDHMVRLFQRMPVNESSENSTMADLHKLLSVRYISSTYQGWQTFKVKSALESWLGDELNLGLMITATDTSDKEVDIKYADKHRGFGEFTPILTVYLRSPGDKLNERNRPRKEIKEPKVLRKKITPLMYGLKRGQIPCSRHIWYVNFEDIGWNNFIVAPKGYMAYRCKGSCSSHLLAEHSNHGKILKLYEDFDESIEGPRCNPTSLKPLMMMFYDTNENIVIKGYEDMVVEKCGCR